VALYEARSLRAARVRRMGVGLAYGMRAALLETTTTLAGSPEA